MWWLNITMRVFHILGAIGLGGSLLFMVLTLLRALKLVEGDFKDTLWRMVWKRSVMLIHGSIGLLIISGAYNWAINMPVYGEAREDGPWLDALLGVKVLIALGVFALVIAMQGGYLKEGSERRWLKIGSLLVVVVVILAAIVRALRLGAM